MRYTTDAGTVNVQFRHVRNEDMIYTSTMGKKKYPKGIDTYTHCSLTFNEGEKDELLAWGRAYVHPTDRLDKEVGRIFSLVRALRVANQTDEVNRQLLFEYFNRGKQYPADPKELVELALKGVHSKDED